MDLSNNATCFIQYLYTIPLYPVLNDCIYFTLVFIPHAAFQEALFNLFAGQTKSHLLMISCLTEKLMFLARLERLY